MQKIKDAIEKLLAGELVQFFRCKKCGVISGVNCLILVVSDSCKLHGLSGWKTELIVLN